LTIAKKVGIIALALWLLVICMSYVNVWIKTPDGTDFWGDVYDSFPHDQMWSTIAITALLATLVSTIATLLCDDCSEEEEAT